MDLDSKEGGRTTLAQALSRVACFAFLTLVTNSCGGKLADDGRNALRRDASDSFGVPGQEDSAGAVPYAHDFSSACADFASVMGRVSCESCVSRANAGRCGTLWSQLESQCQPAYGCGFSSCICTSPCSTATLCSCLAGCLPVADSSCKQLWAEAMQCVGSFCVGGC